MNGSHLAQLTVALAATIHRWHRNQTDSTAALRLLLLAMLTMVDLATRRIINGTEQLELNVDCLELVIC